jgi:uncharacterized protein (TIGR00725 family)
VAEAAAALGEALAEMGAVVICGGMGGVMEAVSRGAKRCGGVVVGVLPGYDRGSGNRFLSIEVPTGLGHARNVLVAAGGDVLVAFPGSAGTLSEIAIALRLGRPVIGVGAWGHLDGVHEVPDAAAAWEKITTLVPSR